MLLIGDVHGKMFQYQHLLGDEESIQLGDVGLGFEGVNFPLVGPQHKFIRGNHDSPKVCRENTHYLGDWGYLPDKKIFFISGAYSIDLMFRTPNKTWWWDEELSHEELRRVVERFGREKPEIVLTHECPTAFRSFCMPNPNMRLVKTRTDEALQACFDVHKPAMWFFGHYHRSTSFNQHGTEFRCLDELETFVI